MSRTPWRIYLAVTTAAIVLMISTEVHAWGSARTIPSYAARVGGHQGTHGSSWSLWLFGAQHGQGCWGTRAAQGGVRREGAACGFEVPRQAWQLAADGVVGPPGNRETILLLLARRSLSRLSILIEGRGGESHQRWVHARVSVIRGHRAQKARLPGAVGYSVVALPGVVCVVHVKPVPPTGKAIAFDPLPACQ